MSQRPDHVWPFHDGQAERDAMIKAGFTMTSVLTQARTVVTETDAENGGAGFTIEVTCLPGRGPNIVEHLHETWTETFEILSGTAQYRLGSKHFKAKSGETIVMPPKVATDGIHAALERAREAAGDLDVRLGGGAATVRQYVRAGLVDELHLAFAPVLLGSGGKPLLRHRYAVVRLSMRGASDYR